MNRLLKVFVLILLSQLPLMAQKQYKIDSLKAILKTDIHDTTRFTVLQNISRHTTFINGDTSAHYARLGLALARKLNDDLKAARMLTFEGIAHWVNSDFDLAIDRFKQAEYIFDSLGDLNGISSINTNLGIIYDNQGKYQLALDHYFKSIKYRDPAYDSVFDWIAHKVNVGAVYNSMGLTQEALDAFMTAIDLAENNPELIDKATKSYVNVANIHLDLGQLDSAKIYIDKVMAAGERQESPTTMADGYELMGTLLTKKKNYLAAIESYKKAESEALKLGSKTELAIIYQGYSQAYYGLGDSTNDRKSILTGLEYANKKIAISEELGLAEDLPTGYKAKSEILEWLGDHKNALLFYQEYDVLSDSLFGEAQSNQVAEMKEKFESEQKQRQIEVQNAKLARQEIELSKQAILRNALIGGLVMLVVIIGLVYRNQRIKNKKNQEIAEKNKAIEESLHEKESLLKEIHHRVKNNLQVISSLLNMQSRGTDSPEMLEVIQEGQSRVKAMSLIHQKLYQTDNLSEIDFQDYISQLIDQLATLYKKKELKVENQVEAREIMLDIDTAIPLGLILNELISNAYKYAFSSERKGLIQIDLKRLDDGQLQLNVSDNGDGLPEDFDLEATKSLGLKLVNILTKQLNGELSYESKNGSRFKIIFNEIKMSA
ncbi:histidine kinase dimerization/phosphoacceptor domain -containing protein [Reichenbachiella sp.]|uniref:tetratricopeptide repeat-containing sensor histidine kinase n=2 Tax=Reichenbachiella sp. TaxID=2184521 RepID=UPI0032985B05